MEKGLARKVGPKYSAPATNERVPQSEDRVIASNIVIPSHLVDSNNLLSEAPFPVNNSETNSGSDPTNNSKQNRSFKLRRRLLDKYKHLT